jgi:hypothetical protein
MAPHHLPCIAEVDTEAGKKPARWSSLVVGRDDADFFQDRCLRRNEHRSCRNQHSDTK